MTKNNSSDSLYAKKREVVGSFVFDDQVAEIFDDMITRSVPGYASIVNMIGCLAQQYVKKDTHCYDLGCSLGAVTAVMRQQINQPGCRIVAVDNSEAMIEKCKINLQQQRSDVKVDVICQDIRDVKIENASVVVLNFTLQFIDPQRREELLKRIYDGILPGGILIVSDKIAFDDKQEEAFQTELHHTFKKLNGYSDLEIAQKRSALENVLIPDTLEHHEQRLTKIGFDRTLVWFQCFNFASLITFKK